MDIPQAFADVNSKFVETVNSHDAHRWAVLFSEDAVLVPAGQPSVSGRNRIEEWGEIATKVWNHLEIQQGRCSADGNVVWRQGTWTGKAHTWNVNPTTQ